METRSKLTMKAKLLFLLLIAGLVPLVLVGFWSSMKSMSALTQLANNQLSRLVRSGKIRFKIFQLKGVLNV